MMEKQLEEEVFKLKVQVEETSKEKKKLEDESARLERTFNDLNIKFGQLSEKLTVPLNP